MTLWQDLFENAVEAGEFMGLNGPNLLRELEKIAAPAK